MKLIFEQSGAGRGAKMLPPLDVQKAILPDEMLRTAPPSLPELSEGELSRHYSALARRAFGVNAGFYPLGSCTMKYNPKLNEEMAALPGFAKIHPLQPEDTAQGCLQVLKTLEVLLTEVTGMDAMSFQPAAGAHGELTGLFLIKAYHNSRGEAVRNRIIVPDSAHGTNPASAKRAGFEVICLPSAADGCVDLEALSSAVGPDTAGLMLTNPNTLGVFDKNIQAITKIVHDAGGLNYYDGANMNAIMGMTRPGDMGFDVIHLNLHKTFSTPHGGGGPGSGPVGVKALLQPFLPSKPEVDEQGRYRFVTPAQSIGPVMGFHGNFLVDVRALTYLVALGGDGLREAAQTAVLNANYLKWLLKDSFPAAVPGLCMHEFVVSLSGLKRETGVSALDVAKGMIDRGMHPPTMYFPLIVPEALMFEPTETESKETLEEAARQLIELVEMAREAPEMLKHAPHHAAIGRPDEVAAARNPKIKA